MRQVSIDIYLFSELSDAAKAKALDWARHLESQCFGDFDPWRDDWVTIGGMFGIEFRHHKVVPIGGEKYARMEPDIFWSLHHQGAGVSYVGKYSHNQKAVAAIKAYAPQDEVLAEIAAMLDKAQAKYDGKLEATIAPFGHSGHCLGVDVAHPDDIAIAPDDEALVRMALRMFAGWMFKYLNTEYDYRTSDEALVEMIESNAYEFTSDGARYR